MRVSFRQNLLPEEGEVCREEETLFRGTDRRGAEAGRGRSAGGGANPPSGDLGADPVSLEETVQGAGDRPGAPVQATAGREWATEAIGGGVDAGKIRGQTGRTPVPSRH